MVVYTLKQHWEVGLRSTYRRCRFCKKKNHLFRWSSFWCWRICKQTKLSHLWHRKPAWDIEKPMHPKRVTVCCGFRCRGIMGHFRSKLSKGRPLQSMAIVIGACWTNFCSQKLKRRILATFGFNWTASLDVLRPFFEDRIISRTADVVWPPRSCDLTPLDYYLWDADKDKWYAHKPEAIDALKDNIREAIGEIQLHTINNVVKNWTDRIGYWMASRGRHLNDHFPLLTGRIVLSNKKRNLRKYSVVF